MKILIEGKNLNPTFELTCRNCQTVVQAEKSELEILSDQLDGDTYVLKCLFCNDTSWYRSSSLEKHIKDNENGTGNA